MERIITFKEYMQREIPILNREYSRNHPITALTNLIIPLLKEQNRKDVLKELDVRIKKLEHKVSRRITIIERWLMSPRSFIKVVSTNKWGKEITTKVFRREVEEDVQELISWIYEEIVYKLLYKEGFDISKMG